MLPWVDLHAEGNRLATPPAGHTAHPHAPKNTKGKRSIINVLVVFVCVCACSVCVVGEGAAAAARRWGVITISTSPPTAVASQAPKKYEGKTRRQSSKKNQIISSIVFFCTTAPKTTERKHEHTPRKKLK